MRIGQRCQAFLDLPFHSLSRDQLKAELDRIGAL
jgi:arsenate reductase